MSETISPSNIYTAINAVMQQVGYVQKTSSPNLKYTYAGERSLIAALRPAMVENGIIVNVEDIYDVEVIEYQTNNGTRMINVALTAKIRFTHAPSGTYLVVTARGEGSDSGDKANNKAQTCAFKYALRQTFTIETGDDPDADDETDRASASNHPQQTKPSQQAKAQPKPAVSTNTTISARTTTTPAPAQTAQMLPANANGRPFSPGALRANFTKAVATIQAKGLALGPDDFAIVQSALTNLTGNSDSMESYLEHVTGNRYLEDLDESQIIALMRLLKPTLENGTWLPCVEAIAERNLIADAIAAEAARIAGEAGAK